MSNTDWWDNEDEFIQHDREQLIKQAWPTIEGLGKPIIISTPEQTNDEIVCMYCSKYCPTWEVVYTGDPDSYEGKEIWCYCNECKTDTFHRLEKRHFNETTTDNSVYTNTQEPQGTA